VFLDPTRERLQKAFDQFIDIREMDDDAVAAMIGQSEVDIAIDLKGYTQGHRAGVFARRPAPIQVSYLGYPGTMGVDFIDYLIGDAYVTPPGEEACYAEKVVRLPGSYQVNDNGREIAASTPTRAEQGLPADGLVFCSFNNTYKITREVFDIWMRLLKATPGSVLWLLGDNEAAVSSLTREAAAKGIAPERLVFAPRLGQAEHLARHRLADLFLDTLPVNAHTTASDALWAGLPVLTCRGRAFIGRVAASVLAAAGLPELITDDLADYEALALKLAREPATLADLRRKLADNRDRCALFDTDRFRRHIEAAYVTMHQAWLEGRAPESFDVAPID
jgi:protein O-GlcNAc transferase